ncbi:Hypothetical_protein [Hexamita inflata]|uniref:Hypothetical_protein n=1 Tax=Hexamita inflata TaxID=28002 RepID=A0AA86TLT7_9EUKA|nr:Hypothetical protein HINF_LOCUS10139 [Hexamita inflata]
MFHVFNCRRLPRARPIQRCLGLRLLALLPHPRGLAALAVPFFRQLDGLSNLTSSSLLLLLQKLNENLKLEQNLKLEEYQKMTQTLNKFITTQMQYKYIPSKPKAIINIQQFGRANGECGRRLNE